MALCYKFCKHNYCGFCSKYKKTIPVSRNPAHYGLLMHPLGYLDLYYDYDKKDLSHLIDIANEYLKDEVSQNILQQYKDKGYITYKQRKYLVYNILHCCEDKYSIPKYYNFI
jgi:hypothetical protein